MAHQPQHIRRSDRQGGGVAVGMNQQRFSRQAAVEDEGDVPFPVVHKPQRGDRAGGQPQLFKERFFTGKGQFTAPQTGAQRLQVCPFMLGQGVKKKTGAVGEKQVFHTFPLQGQMQLVAVRHGVNRDMLLLLKGNVQFCQQRVQFHTPSSFMP